MTFQVGDTVIHWTYGPGKVIEVDDKGMPGEPCFYYVIETNERTLWVPVIESGSTSLHLRTQPTEFKRLIDILRTPGVKMPNNLYHRKGQIDERMKKRTLDESCLIIRDLNTRSRSHKLSNYEIGVLKRAEAFLLDEWELSIGTTRESAKRELKWLLKENLVRKNDL